jgi:plastocyanin
MKLNFRSMALCTALLALGAAGCGSDSKKKAAVDTGPANAPAATNPGGQQAPGGAGGGKSSNLTLSADPSGQLKFDKSSLSAKAGSVTITMDNPAPVPHAIAVEGNGIDKDGQTVSKDGKSTVTATLKAGTYTFYCPVDGHKAAGMKGTLTVK